MRTVDDDPEFIDACGHAELVDCVHPAPGDEVHLYGSDESVGELRGSLARDVVVRVHGTGMGLAIVGEGVGLSAAASAIARM